MGVRKGPAPHPLPVRFWAKVQRSPDPQACWPWRGACSRKRAGTRRGHLRHGPRTLLAHRVALWLATDPTAADLAGYDCPHGDPTLQACHGRMCTTRLCCNPAHLYWGTRAENEADRYHGKLLSTRLLTMAEAVLQTVVAGPSRLPYADPCGVSLPDDSIWRPLRGVPPPALPGRVPRPRASRPRSRPALVRDAREKPRSDHCSANLRPLSLFEVEEETA